MSQMLDFSTVVISKMPMAKKYLLLLILMQVGASVQDTKHYTRLLMHRQHEYGCAEYCRGKSTARRGTFFCSSINNILCLRLIKMHLVIYYFNKLNKLLTTSLGSVARSSYSVVTVFASASRMTASPRSCLRTDCKHKFLN